MRRTIRVNTFRRNVHAVVHASPVPGEAMLVPTVRYCEVACIQCIQDSVLVLCMVAWSIATSFSGAVLLVVLVRLY